MRIELKKIKAGVAYSNPGSPRSLLGFQRCADWELRADGRTVAHLHKSGLVWTATLTSGKRISHNTRRELVEMVVRRIRREENEV